MGDMWLKLVFLVLFLFEIIFCYSSPESSSFGELTSDSDSDRSKSETPKFCAADGDTCRHACHAHGHGEETDMFWNSKVKLEGVAVAGPGVGDALNLTDDDGWDPNGYVTFCPSLGNFGNQVEQYLGTIVFAKALNRTLILPPFQHVTYRQRRVVQILPFTELFQVARLQEFHRVVTMEDFLKRLAPKYWPPGQRKSYSLKFPGIKCTTNQGSGPFWTLLDPPVLFDECIHHELRTAEVLNDENSMMTAKRAWNKRFPAQEHPVLALSQAKGTFPIVAANRQVQKYFQWTEEFSREPSAYVAKSFGTDIWVSVHLRNGDDWVKACSADIERQAFVMASPQCHDIKIGAVTMDMCLPSLSHMLELTLRVFKDVNAKHLFIATDKHPYLNEFRTLLKPLGIIVHHLNPDTPQTDLVILGQASYFIGTCTSSFSSFVKRERDARGKPSIFWGQDYDGFH